MPRGVNWPCARCGRPIRGRPHSFMGNHYHFWCKARLKRNMRKTLRRRNLKGKA